MKNTKKNFNRNILICVYGFFFICVLCGFIVWAAYRERDFSPKGWMNCDPAKRYLYIEDFEEKGKTDARFKELAKITKEHNGLWSKEAEDYLLANF